MQIRQVEKQTGIPVQSIRYYEREGLILPDRNQDNRYREYSTEDVDKLKTIGFCRKLGMSIREIRQLLQGELSLRQCVEIAMEEAREEQYAAKAREVLCQAVLEQLDRQPEANALDCAAAVLISLEAKHLYDHVIPPENRRPKPNWGVVFLLAVALPVAIFGIINFAMIGVTVSLNGTLNEIYAWMAQPDTVFSMEYQEKALTVDGDALHPAIHNLEQTLMQPKPAGIPMWGEAKDPIVVTIRNGLGEGVLRLSLVKKQAIGLQWETPQGASSGLLISSASHILFGHLADEIKAS